MFTAALMLALTSGEIAPDGRCGRGGRCGGHGCYSSGGYGGYGGCGYGGCGYGGGGYSGDYQKAPDETDEEFDFCKKQAENMPQEAYPSFRSAWLRMNHQQRNKMMGKKQQKQQDEASARELPVMARHGLSVW